MHTINHPRSSIFAARSARAAFFAVALLALVCLIALAGMAGSPVASAASHAQQGASLRIGTYDSRAVAVAYVRSDLSAKNLNELLRQRDEAEKAGNQKRVKELNEQGESLQVRRHLQGFSTAPIEDILDTVREQLPQVAKRANVVAILRTADWHDATIEVVDVTDEVVRLFNPDAQTLKIVAEVRKRQPAAIETVAKMPAKQ